MSEEPILAAVGDYYAGKLLEHGPTARGVDWNSPESQELRFDQLLKILPDELSHPVSILDYGCGYGALLDYLVRQRRAFQYVGFDISPQMIGAARERLSDRPDAEFFTKRSTLHPADYVLASGILNVKLETPETEWEKYVLGVIDEFDKLSIKGFAFNILTRHSDPERRRSDLYYADPGALFNYCIERFSRRVALLHDYPLYEFTLLVRKEARGG